MSNIGPPACKLLLKSRQVPSKPEKLRQVPSKPEKLRQVRQVPSRPEKLRQVPSRPEKLRQVPSKPEKLRQVPSRPEKLRQVPSKPGKPYISMLTPVTSPVMNYLSQSPHVQQPSLCIKSTRWVESLSPGCNAHAHTHRRVRGHTPSIQHASIGAVRTGSLQHGHAFVIGCTCCTSCTHWWCEKHQ